MSSCPECRREKDLIEKKLFAGSRLYFACVNKDCPEFHAPPEVIRNCGTHDTFSYQAGVNMERAKDQRRVNETHSHMGGTDEIYRHLDDLNNDAAWREEGYDAAGER